MTSGVRKDMYFSTVFGCYMVHKLRKNETIFFLQIERAYIPALTGPQNHCELLTRVNIPCPNGHSNYMY